MALKFIIYVRKLSYIFIIFLIFSTLNLKIMFLLSSSRPFVISLKFSNITISSLSIILALVTLLLLLRPPLLVILVPLPPNRLLIKVVML